MKQRKTQRHFGLLLLFVAVLFACGLINSGITALTVYKLIQDGVLSVIHPAVNPEELMLGSAILSVLVGLIVALMVTKFPLRPVRELIDGMDRLADGDFATRISAGKIMRRYPAFVAVSESFNKMATELEQTEMLRGDFINSISHEFKTPIVSIAGFARLLRQGGLTPEQQQEYLSIIEEESMRLSYMATNVLNLSKVENQSILTDVCEFNLSEQIRSCFLLLESKWSRRDLELELDFGEYNIRASEELLKQVWINLLDNAVKFTPDGHLISVRIRRQPHAVAVEVRNTGSVIAPEDQGRIFNKFFQADPSRSTLGNGVGLAIVKHITQLHGGSVSVRSDEDGTVFTVELPQ